MTSKNPVRNCDDVDEIALSYAEIKSLCIGDPRIKEKMDLEIEMSRLKTLRADYQNQKYRLEDAIMIHYPRTILSTEAKIAGYLDDLERLKTGTVPNKDGFSPMKIGNVTHTEKAKAGQALIDMFSSVGAKPVEIGEYRGFKMNLYYNTISETFAVDLKGATDHSLFLGSDVHGNIARINNMLSDIKEDLDEAEQQLESTKKSMEQAKEEIGKPFRHEEQFQKQSARLLELDRELSLETQKPPEGVKNDDLENDDKESYQADGDSLEMVAEPLNTGEYTHCEEEPDYDEPDAEQDEPSPEETISQGLQTRLENDFGKLPPNIVIGGVPNHGSDFGNNSASGINR